MSAQPNSIDHWKGVCLRYAHKHLMSNPLSNFQEYFKEIEAEMEALRTAVRAQEEASRPQPSSSKVSALGDIPVMHFQGPVEPFTLTVKQLEIVRACWNEVQGFLSVNGIGENPGQVHHESAYKASPDSKAPRRPAS